MNLGRLYQIILKSDKEISGYGQLAQHAIFAYHMVRQTPLIAIAPAALPWFALIRNLIKGYESETKHFFILNFPTNKASSLPYKNMHHKVLWVFLIEKPGKTSNKCPSRAIAIKLRSQCGAYRILLQKCSAK